MKQKENKKRKMDLPVDSTGASMAMMMAIQEGFSHLEDFFDFSPPKQMLKKSEADPFNWCAEIRELKKESMRTIAWRLQKKGLIEKTGEEYQLSVFGMETIRRVKEEEKEKQKWDGAWRIAMFNIPEAKRSERDWIRKELLNMEYRPLQRSVFAGQYPFSKDFIEELKKRKLNDCVKTLTVHDVDESELENILNWKT